MNEISFQLYLSLAMRYIRHRTWRINQVEGQNKLKPWSHVKTSGLTFVNLYVKLIAANLHSILLQPFVAWLGSFSVHQTADWYNLVCQLMLLSFCVNDTDKRNDRNQSGQSLPQYIYVQTDWCYSNRKYLRQVATLN